MIKIVFYVSLFAVATMIIYTWGLMKQRSLQSDLVNTLYTKAQKKVLSSLKKNGSMCRKDIENELKGIKASSFFSKNKLVVTDPKILTKNILDSMMKKDLLQLNRSTSPPRYTLK